MSATRLGRFGTGIFPKSQTRSSLITSDHQKSIENLNEEFDLIKSYLEKYLSQIDDTLAVMSPIEGYVKLFTEDFIHNEFILPYNKWNHNHEKPNNLYFVNFNYTSTFQKLYFEEIKGIIRTSTLNNIHGKLNSAKNPIIFGYGDELDKQYKQFEDKNNNSLFKHIKSFGYSKTPNYHDLIRFIESDYYQVFIIGHSCGLSDRTMLNEIFEHDNCKSIKIFFHEKPDGTTDFVEKTYEISRHFIDKASMRRKIVPEVFSKSMPQALS